MYSSLAVQIFFQASLPHIMGLKHDPLIASLDYRHGALIGNELGVLECILE